MVPGVRVMLSESATRAAVVLSGVEKVVISGGYAQIDDKGVIILADHARLANDIEPDVVRETRDTALDTLNGLDAGDGRRAYWENKVKWCNLLLKQAAEQKQN